MNTIVVRAVVGFHPYTSTDKWTVNITVIRAGFDSTHTRGSVLKPSCKSILLSTQFHKYLLPLHHEE